MSITITVLIFSISLLITLLLWALPAEICEIQLIRIQQKYESSLCFLQQKFRTLEDRGELLWDAMSKLRYQSGMLKESKVSLPEYKYYTSLSLQLLAFQRKGGALPGQLWDDLLGKLREDIHFERRLKSQFLGSIGQFLTVAVIIWLFIVYSDRLTKPAISQTMVFAVVTVMHILGFIVFKFFQGLLKNYIFKGVPEFIRTMLFLLGLSSAHLSIKQVLEMAQLNELHMASFGRLKQLNERLFEVINTWKRTGRPVRQDLLYLLSDAWDEQQQRFKKYEQATLLCRFFILVIFFLGSYFFYLYNLISRFLIE